MTDNPKGTVEERMHRLRVRYVEHLEEQVEQLEQLLMLCTKNKLATGERTELRSLAHKLAGSGTTYGFPEITDTARTLEEYLLDHKEGDGKVILSYLQMVITACRAAIRK